MVKRRKDVNADEILNAVLDAVDEENKQREEEEKKIRSSNEYILWLKDFLEKQQCFIDYDIIYAKENMEEGEYKNICNLKILFSIIQKYYQKYYIFPTFVDTDGTLIYRVYYKDFCFEIGQVEYLESYIEVRKVESIQDAINYEDIMKDKELKGYKDKEKFIKEFHEQIRKSKEKAKELGIGIEYLKEIVEIEF